MAQTPKQGQPLRAGENEGGQDELPTEVGGIQIDDEGVYDVILRRGIVIAGRTHRPAADMQLRGRLVRQHAQDIASVKSAS